MSKVLIIGDPVFNDYIFLRKKLDDLKLKISRIIVLGNGKISNLSYLYAENNEVPVSEFCSLEGVDALVAFTRGGSSVCKSIISNASLHGISYAIFGGWN